MPTAIVRKKKIPSRLKLSVDVHPELRKALKVAAAQQERTISEVVHAILCRELKRSDLAAAAIR